MFNNNLNRLFWQSELKQRGRFGRTISPEASGKLAIRSDEDETEEEAAEAAEEEEGVTEVEQDEDDNRDESIARHFSSSHDCDKTTQEKTFVRSIKQKFETLEH
jgi:hypothetical protein